MLRQSVCSSQHRKPNMHLTQRSIITEESRRGAPHEMKKENERDATHTKSQAEHKQTVIVVLQTKGKHERQREIESVRQRKEIERDATHTKARTSKLKHVADTRSHMCETTQNHDERANNCDFRRRHYVIFFLTIAVLAKHEKS